MTAVASNHFFVSCEKFSTTYSIFIFPHAICVHKKCLEQRVCYFYSTGICKGIHPFTLLGRILFNIVLHISVVK